ncbi:unnamed protein product [Owenia fusiformis]|uniref:C2H2-type domain-containing protein n=2 Tax=Owenia fusiformis TaxID=6347 RepID=A0A8S4N654_OWEFU|nr:unnamed protein product [Owenia fusiformis]
MGTYNPMITQMIQDAVLKLCTQNIMFQKSLEIDGIICVSSGEEQRDIVVKMHRTIVKPEVAPTPVESWSPSLEADWQNTANTNTPRNTSFDSYDSSTPRRSESRPGHRGPYKSKHTVVNEPPKRTFNEVHEPPEPTATQETPGGLDIDSDYSVTNIKAEPDTSPNSKRKNSDSNLDQNEEVPAKLAKYNIKEEAITIELNDEEDDDGGEGDTETAGASWMGAEGDDTTRTFDNMDSMNNTYASADTGDESQMHDAGGAMQVAGGDMGDQSDLYPYQMGINKSNDGQSLRCPLCFKTYKGKGSLAEHTKFFHGKEEYRCCGKLFTWERSYRRHKHRCHPDLP